MPCSCAKNRKTFEVVTSDKVVYSSTSEPTAKAVSKRYPGSIVREQAKSGAKAS
ncbi:hypothetical protein RM574_13305 [Streptomyces sp. DSM 41982]|uniref:DUF397 domain-containing protein n=1 Tax=Streptomyces evansiae TaxID=3075535 RepID=A0ABD5E4V3_9ACTN|nr:MULTISPECIES: hypothetical protein [unclassified Streptomyces]MDT0416464.1 hypothetical protein [Streptomyces sp. DSM 41982]SCD57733.1 hypothetical protein GA0115246_1033515 [Streptomyces sp. SolWspMP-sol7th]